MPNRFCCKFCGVITDNPEIVPHPETEKEIFNAISELRAQIDAIRNVHEKVREGHDIRLDELAVLYSHLDEAKKSLVAKYNYSITCPVCQNETRFWRDEPFPTDKP